MLIATAPGDTQMTLSFEQPQEGAPSVTLQDLKIKSFAALPPKSQTEKTYIRLYLETKILSVLTHFLLNVAMAYCLAFIVMSEYCPQKKL